MIAPDSTDVHLGDHFQEKDIPGLVRVLFDTFLGIWQGKQIICVGDECVAPPPEYPATAIDLYNLKYEVTMSLSDVAKSLANGLSHDPNKRQLFLDQYSQHFEERFPAQERYVLLNLDSREYVVSKGLSGRNLLDKSGWGKPELGHAAILKSLWSQDSSTSMQVVINTEGDWAGNRFSIMSESQFQKRDQKGWEDVSETVFEILEKIWKSQGYEKRNEMAPAS